MSVTSGLQLIFFRYECGQLFLTYVSLRHTRSNKTSHPRLRPCGQGVQQYSEKDRSPHPTSHGLRHANATAVLEASIDPQIGSQTLGYTSASTTYDIYAHVIPELETEVAKKIEAKLLGR